MNLTELRKQREELNKQLLEASKAAFHDGAQTIFNAHPKLEKFSWTQYTPYFNDGDECKFSVNKDYFDITFGGEEHDGICEWDFRENDKPAGLKEAYEAIEAILGQIEDAELKEMFGDHCRPVVTKGGVEVEEYSHD